MNKTLISSKKDRVILRELPQKQTTDEELNKQAEQEKEMSMYERGLENG